MTQDERNFCSRCGKRTADLTTIHTCTPPMESGAWVDLTPQDYAEIFRTARSVDHAARLATAKLKEKNT